MESNTPRTDIFLANWDRYNFPEDAIEHARQLEAELDAAKRALAELVACKDLKERIIELADPMNWSNPPELSALNAEYKHRQPLAWKAARAALAAKSTEHDL